MASPSPGRVPTKLKRFLRQFAQLFKIMSIPYLVAYYNTDQINLTSLNLKAVRIALIDHKIFDEVAVTLGWINHNGAAPT